MAINKFRRIQRGFDFKKEDLFPHTKGLCGYCHKPLPEHKRRWCSEPCREQSYLKYAVIKGDIQIIRLCLMDRDNGKCAKCGEITNDWEADHIIEVRHGGGGCTLDNFQTLCIPCHKAKTKANFK